MNLVDVIYQAMSTDEEDTDDQSERLWALYENATSEQKDAINRALICICGWSMANLMSETT